MIYTYLVFNAQHCTINEYINVFIYCKANYIFKSWHHVASAECSIRVWTNNDLSMGRQDRIFKKFRMGINTQITLLPQNPSNKDYYLHSQLLGNACTRIHINFKNHTFHVAILQGNISITYFHKTRKLKNVICAETAKSISTVYLWSRTTSWFW